MNLSDFYYDLPKELIAQTPIERRDDSRLLIVDKKTGKLEDSVFNRLSDCINEGDCLILNNSKVLPARLFGIKANTGAVIEVVLLVQKEGNVWEVLVKPGKKAVKGVKLTFGDGILEGSIIDIVDDGNRLIEFKYEGIFYEILDKIGKMPLPPYITEELKDKDRYQTVYAKEKGSAAAPTAGFHFTKELLESINSKGVEIGFVTLHIGLGTFRPVKVKNITEHKMHTEHFFLPQRTADIINRTKARGGKVIAVGTTSCRTLETVAAQNGGISEAEGWTDFFIYPGYEFKVIDALITNFHLPESTLIMLVSAFAGRENILNAYSHAINEKYRFFSFGDAMLIK